ncbi:glycosyltransferase family 4 protein [Prosthecobacter sp. SYSU 5D2]|uniref:glycosyltransferase family 4 protein n=1 Tax=Prosthecobacter sp. SYSU 5D2 TaxID=3134134 RepID=UPI0031FE5C1B
MVNNSHACIRPLRILMLAVPFYPMTGGLETVAAVLADEMSALGQDVTLVTLADTEAADRRPYKIIRRPSVLTLLWQFLQADCVLIHGITLHLGWPALFRTSSTVIIHHGFCILEQPLNFMRRLLLRGATNVVISKAVGTSVTGDAPCIYNPYESSIFRIRPVKRVPGSLIFVGRLVPEKGALVLIEALAHLKKRGLAYPLTVVGEGPCRDEIMAAVKAHGLTDHISLAGRVTGDSLAELMNRHHVAVIPSFWAEPFGVVAVEAIACGCEVIGTSDGGLPEAIGPCGVTVPNGNVEALAAAIENLAAQPLRVEEQEEIREAHLQQFQPARVAGSYLNLIHRMLGLSA